METRRAAASPIKTSTSDCAGTTQALDRLLRPRTTAEFFARYWERRCLNVSRNCPDYFSDLLTISDVDAITGRTSSELRLVKADDDEVLHREAPTGPEGRPDIYYVYKAYTEGYTVIVNRLEVHWQPVASLCRELEGLLHHDAFGVAPQVSP
jgi:hypothetical protein